MIKFIYFDVGSVIVDNEAAMQSVARMHNVTRDQIFAIVEANWKAGCLGTLSTKDYFTLFTEKLGITHQSFDMADFWSDHQGFFQETHDFIHELEDNYRLGILSNAELGILQKLLDKKKIPNVKWEVIVESAQYGVIKPDPKIYEIAESLVPDLKPHELLFIDDYIEMVDAAKKRGWHGEVFDPKDKKGSIARIKKVLLHTNKHDFGEG